jgi:hypothetical protein
LGPKKELIISVYLEIYEIQKTENVVLNKIRAGDRIMAMYVTRTGIRHSRRGQTVDDLNRIYPR